MATDHPAQPPAADTVTARQVQRMFPRWQIALEHSLGVYSATRRVGTAVRTIIAPSPGELVPKLTAAERGDPGMLTGDDHRLLIWLQAHWSGHYVISVTDGVWRAARVASPAIVLLADSARELRDLMRDDYAAMASERRQAQQDAGGSL
jgi:hypothetical protein